MLVSLVMVFLLLLAYLFSLKDLGHIELKSIFHFHWNTDPFAVIREQRVIVKALSCFMLFMYIHSVFLWINPSACEASLCLCCWGRPCLRTADTVHRLFTRMFLFFFVSFFYGWLIARSLGEVVVLSGLVLYLLCGMPNKWLLTDMWPFNKIYHTCAGAVWFSLDLSPFSAAAPSKNRHAENNFMCKITLKSHIYTQSMSFLAAVMF